MYRTEAERIGVSQAARNMGVSRNTVYRTAATTSDRVVLPFLWISQHATKWVVAASSSCNPVCVPNTSRSFLSSARWDLSWTTTRNWNNSSER